MINQNWQACLVTLSTVFLCLVCGKSLLHSKIMREKEPMTMKVVIIINFPLYNKSEKLMLFNNVIALFLGLVREPIMAMAIPIEA